MKRFTFLAVLTALMFNALTGAVLCAAVGVEPIVGAVGMNVVGAVGGMVAPAAGVLRAGVYKEVWIGEMVKKLRGGLLASWLDGIPDASSAVKDGDVIHLVDAGVDPDVLINNTTYPIPFQDLSDSDIAISLDKFQTKVTPITDDELEAISYDKMSRVLEAHGDSISDAKYKKAAHAFCAQSHSAITPVLATTGEVDAATGRRKLTRTDLIALKTAMDKLKVPAQDRRLVLCSDHVQDILGWCEQFEKQYSLDNKNGKIGRLYGFDIYEFANNPYYTAAGVKKALGASASTGEFQCSFAFYTKRVFKATGSTKVYYSRAENDPEYQRNKINFRHRFIALPKKLDAGAVMMSAYVAPTVAAAPTIQGDDSVEVAATAGSNYRTYATSNGAGVTATTEAEWLSVSVSGNKVTFTRQAYAYDAEAPETRSATVIIGIEGTEVTKTVTVTQAMAANE